jgi:hypothetical protein
MNLKPIKNKRILVASAKAKGRNLQKWTAKIISKSITVEYKEGDESLICTRPMGQNGVDIILRGEAKKKFPFSVECKSTQHWNLFKSISQAKKNIIAKTDWLLVLKRKEIKEPVVVLSANRFFSLIRNQK